LQNINSILKEKKRTSVFVAHRLRTIYDSDQILVLKDGRVAEMGSHRELLDLNGIYAELWNAQEMSLAQDLEFERETERDDVEPKERDMAPGPKAQQ
jgi:ABC transporter ATM